ncbi:MAG: hypothetical protein EZS26_001985 [Candidatus Ordinivivax streblomastigis]|uniref:Asl1-like glycosyl hydrolase catalytic domain-containing protein n=1 Tax=Candidatus Ordinivivax streblomastigis TaxID=2540710 RepID=A0A5M8P0B3_9BACT|nr:MAG: hypothetical protein EZS26_001985 [Candidatus Ordinivivax streblomastigis]
MKIQNQLKFFLLSTTLFGCIAMAQAETVTNVTSNRTLSGSDELHITDASNPISNGAVINITSTDAYLFFDKMKPSLVLSNYKNSIQINGAAIDPTASNPNCRLVVYREGAAVIPHSSTYQPLETFTEANFAGNSQKYTVDQYYSTAHISDIPSARRSALSYDNAIRSFKLKRGYMATFANEPSGLGYSRCFIADKEDLIITQIPPELDQKVSFIRVFPWEWVSKKGWCGGKWDSQVTGWKWGCEQSDHTNSTWFYDWGASLDANSGKTVSTLINQEFVPEKWGAGGGTGVFYSNKRWSHLVGQNEPDHTEQSNVSVTTAIAEWPTLMKTGARLGSPATTDFSWLYSFMDVCKLKNYRVDYVVIHCYWSKTPQQWYNDLKAVHTRTGRPIWIKEWNNGANWTTEGGWTKDADGNRIYNDANADKQYTELKAILNVLDTASFVERYSIYNWVEDARAIILDSKLTKAGEYYASTTPDFAFNQDKEVVPVWTTIPPKATFTFTPANGKVNLSWTDTNLELLSKFSIQKKVAGTTTWTEIAEVDASTTEYLITTLASGATPDNAAYRVQAVGTNTTVGNSNVVGYAIDQMSPRAGLRYRIKNVQTGYYLTTTAAGATTISSKVTEGANQIYDLYADASDNEHFNIGINGKYLSLSTENKWTVTLGTSRAASEAENILTTNEDGYTTIQVLYYAGQNKYLAPQAYSLGSTCYYDTNGGTTSNAPQYWAFEEEGSIDPGTNLNPATGKKYRIKNVWTNSYLTINTASSSNPITINTSVADGTNQIFDLLPDESNPDNYNIGINGQYVVQSSGHAWDAVLDGSRTDSKAEFILDSNTGGQTTIQALANAGQDAYLAPQANSIGTICYVDTKAASNLREWWVFEPTEPITAIPQVENEVHISTLSNGSLHISTGTRAKVAVLDISGRTLASYPSNGNLTIDLNYTNGLYIIRIDTDGKISSHKVILRK